MAFALLILFASASAGTPLFMNGDRYEPISENSLFEATAQLMDVKRVKEGDERYWKVLLQAKGLTIEGYAIESCRFLDERGEEISASDFFRRYAKRTIDMQVDEDSNRIVEFKVPRR
jgi:hypothetical protein